MELVRNNQNWDSIDLLTDLGLDMNRIFNPSLLRRDGGLKTFDPDIEVKEEIDRYVISADLPGLKREDFKISLEGNTLTLSGERKQEKEENKGGAYFSERLYGAFSRTIELPTEVQGDKIKAAYKDGVLQVTLPKSEHAKPKQIAVNVE